MSILRDNESLTKRRVNLCLNKGGVGDQICRAPAVKYAIEAYPNIIFNIIVPDYCYDIYLLWCEGKAVVVRMTELGEEDAKFPSYWFGEGFVSTLGTHLVDHAFLTFLDQIPKGANKNYLPLPVGPKIAGHGEYVVITPGFTAAVRALPAATYNEIISGIKAKGMNVVVLGKSEVADDITGKFSKDLDLSECIDLRDATTLLGAASIMGNAVAVMGLDNGLLHLAACTQAPIIAAYSSQLPSLRLPYRKGQLGWNCKVIAPKGCNGCEAKLRFEYQHDFRTCFFKDEACLKELTADKFLKALDTVIGEQNHVLD